MWRIKENRIRVIRRCAIFLVEIQRGGKRMDEIPRCFMMLRKETMTPEMGWRSAVAFPRRSALTMVRSASFRIRRPMATDRAQGISSAGAAATDLTKQTTDEGFCSRGLFLPACAARGPPTARYFRPSLISAQ
jgi:hypothetical protein